MTFAEVCDDCKFKLPLDNFGTKMLCTTCMYKKWTAYPKNERSLLFESTLGHSDEL